MWNLKWLRCADDYGILIITGEIIRSSYVSIVQYRMVEERPMSLNIKLGSLSINLSFWTRLVLSFVYRAHHALRRAWHFSPTKGVAHNLFSGFMEMYRCKIVGDILLEIIGSIIFPKVWDFDFNRFLITGLGRGSCWWRWKFITYKKLVS